MNQTERRHRFALLVLVSLFLFCILLVAISLAAIVINIALTLGLIQEGFSMEPRAIVMLMGAISLVIGGALTALLGRFTLKPVNRFIDQMNRLAAGDFKARMYFHKPFNTYPTFVEISDSFNKMAEELGSTEMLRADFINNFSHEFKTPIVSIAGFAKLLRKGNLTREEYDEYLRIIEEESMRLSAMATNVLNLTKFENQTILTDVTSFNLSEQIRNSILSLEGKWSKKQIEFNLDFTEYEIEANRDMLKHVWINLIDNAIKFSPTGGEVDISIKQKNDTLVVSVANTGAEIPPEQQEKIFHKFYQADESHASEGNGIGLSLVKEAVDLHGGSVSVTSQNQMTTFLVTLPQKHL